MSAIIVVVALLLLLTAVTGLYWRKRRHRASPISAPTIVREPSQHAIVLAHGVLGFDHLQVMGVRQHYFRGVAKYLEQRGGAVFTAKVAGLGTVPERAQALTSFIEELDEKRVVVVGHSMGGLDARYGLSKLGLTKQVKALITIATPHRGSYLAQATELLPSRALLSLLGKVGVATDALQWLGEGPSEEFNNTILDVSGVFYGCIVGETSRSGVLGNPLLMAGYEILLRARGANDGMVPASSQKWGKEIAVVPANHFAQIGWSTGFDACAMYLDLLRTLNGMGLKCLPESIQEVCDSSEQAIAG